MYFITMVKQHSFYVKCKFKYHTIMTIIALWYEGSYRTLKPAETEPRIICKLDIICLIKTCSVWNNQIGNKSAWLKAGFTAFKALISIKFLFTKIMEEKTKECVHRIRMPMLSSKVNRGITQNGKGGKLWNQTFYGPWSFISISNDLLNENLCYWMETKCGMDGQPWVKLHAPGT